MSSISEVVAVTVSVQDTAPSVAGFGTPLILAHCPFVAAVREYDAEPSGLTAMVADGFATTSDAYRKAQAIMSQNPHCPSFKVAPRDTGDNDQAGTLTPAYTTEGKKIEVSLAYSGTTYSCDYTIQNGDTATDICDEVRSQLGAISGLTLAGTDTVTIVHDSIGEDRYYLSGLVGLGYADTSADAGIATDLAAVNAIDSDWYGLLCDTQSPLEIAAAAVWAAANEKLYGALSVDEDNLTDDDGVAYTIQQTTNHNTYCYVTRDGGGNGAAALMGRQFSRNPGSTTWAMKQLTGPTADAWTASEQANAEGNGALLYVITSGVSHTQGGTSGGAACSGRHLDITRGIAWLKARIQEAVLAALLNNEKIPFTDAGAGLIEAAVRGVLSLAESRLLLAPGWNVTRPAVADVSQANKTNRIFPDMKFTGVLQGAIQKVLIDGTVTT